MKSVLALVSLMAVSNAFLVPSFRTRSLHSMRIQQNDQSPGEMDNVVPASSVDSMKSNMKTVSKKVFTVVAATSAPSLVSSSIAPTAASARDAKVWEKVDLPVRETLFDVTFDTKRPDHGWLIGAKGTFFESFDGGNTWVTRSFTNLDEDEEITYRFEIADLNDNEGWIVGKPSILLHTKDGGKQFERIPLPPRLPGDPVFIKSTGSNEAEMMTSQGAIYKTTNGGLNWKAQVKETIDATLNRVSSSGTSGASYFNGKVQNQIRDKNGNYIAITSRGNLFLTWQPGQDYWLPHNRGSARRIQNMGFIGDDVNNGLWMTLNGGTMLKTGPGVDISAIELSQLFKQSKLNSGGYGIIDVTWKNPENVWAVGGSGIVFESKDAGSTFKFNENAKDIPGNLYRVKFFDNGKLGFVLGSDGVLLKYTPQA